MTNAVGGSTISSALYAGVQGFNQGAEQVQQASLDIASSNTRQQNAAQQNAGGESNRLAPNLNTSAVEIISGSNQAEASAKVIKAADEMLGTIIDTFA
ncbi:hypothetical protein ISG33_13470 [Glaciecola sp. MH2013]|uniref:flagellar basal body rod C-terminal domain-containing protein n=1 Tax=Glaciecola sp. MH2013 TaxID=2785524 RepID=UPI0018A01CAB|nr:hypothetical protein [Glaciecola sp. MH2013]MBF7074410.1 hypothetical protein [Glaciecola sp. MH2013]